MIFILVEIRNENTIDISGYVNVVERESRKLARGGGKPDFYEKVKAGTFDKALQKNPAVPIFFNHERPISTDSLPELREDNVGLHASMRRAVDFSARKMIFYPHFIGMAQF